MSEAVKVNVSGAAWLPERPYGFYAVHQRLTEIVSSTSPGFAYAKPSSAGLCSYWHLPDAEDTSDLLGRPGCIVGRLLYSFGVPREVLLACDDASHGLSTGWSSVKRNFPGMFTSQASMMLKHIQVAQDDGKPWSELPALALSWRQGWGDALAAVQKSVRQVEVDD